MRYFYLFLVLSVIATVSICGFRGSHSGRPPLELFPDMVRQNKVRPETPSDFFDDHLASRPVPEGTVARTKPYEINGEVLQVGGKAVYPYEDSPINTGRIPGTTNWVVLEPLPITGQFLKRGQQRFEIYCSPCHGPDGDGRGITSKYAMAGMANFHDQRLVEMTAGELFNTITYGKPLMGGYGASVPVQDRWAIIAYVRVLQRSQLGSIEDVPASEKSKFK
jgi:mono/diheme cytochrome c family protein